jgi:alpha-methylacyl-CoA racemase
MAGPLNGIRIIEMAGIGPGPFCGMMLADHGAEVVRVERPGARLDPRDPLLRSRRSIAIDVKRPEGAALVRELARSADGVIEGFRPGVMERLGLGPEVLLGDNPKLVYGRMTGWGQHGPLAQAAGHDINYTALSGALHTVGIGGKPVPPVNYLGDFAGGGMMLAFAMVSALLAVRMGGEGDVIDCAMTEGSALIAGFTGWLQAMGLAQDAPGAGLLDGGAHFYDTYETADGQYVAFGAIEPQFQAIFREKLGLTGAQFDDHMNPARWPQLKEQVAAVVRTRTRDEWCALLEGTDACFAPVLTMGEAPAHPHNAARGSFVEVGGTVQPGPAPSYGRRALDAPRLPGAVGGDTDAVLTEIGLGSEQIGALRSNGIVG